MDRADIGLALIVFVVVAGLATCNYNNNAARTACYQAGHDPMHCRGLD